MFCPKCGTENSENVFECSNCGTDFSSRRSEVRGIEEVVLKKEPIEPIKSFFKSKWAYSIILVWPILVPLPSVVLGELLSDLLRQLIRMHSYYWISVIVFKIVISGIIFVFYFRKLGFDDSYNSGKLQKYLFWLISIPIGFSVFYLVPDGYWDSLTIFFIVIVVYLLWTFTFYRDKRKKGFISAGLIMAIGFQICYRYMYIYFGRVELFKSFEFLLGFVPYLALLAFFYLNPKQSEGKPF